MTELRGDGIGSGVIMSITWAVGGGIIKGGGELGGIGWKVMFQSIPSSSLSSNSLPASLLGNCRVGEGGLVTPAIIGAIIE